MYDTAKYLIHANITAEGVVERSDVVGAVFGQTEGLLGDELDLRDLQDSSKIGRIDVEIDSEQGQSFGTVTIASGLDQVETAILAAALETIERVGPCRSRVEIDRIEDVRAAKRRQIVDRAKTLLGEAFDGGILTSEELVEEVRRSIRVEDITEYDGLPAGPRVEDSDAIIVVEGRSDVLTLLQYGVKNAIGVEGTNVPAPITELATERTVTVFFDGDRGGDLILKELSQVANIDYVAITPPGRNVEDLSRSAVMKALREKVPYETVADAGTPRDAMAATDGSARPAPPAATPPSSDVADSEPADTDARTEITDERAPSDEHTPQTEPETLRGHTRSVIVEDTGSVRLLDEQFDTLDEGNAEEAFDRIKACEPVPAAVVLDDELSQRILDIAAQRGVAQIVARETAAFVKQPTSVRVRTGDQLVQTES
ncbi:DNA primase DnaG [Halocatena salina]|uniref:DNA primase DnaG n=1 Tax=Halocatena salina TaxID=2934340 RepID=A0A8U0A2I1_9EURY|nr:DNA primase DnaG [Halocatena salina]UPM43282.1 DNA primase DnaG [Halocatena salina]